MAKLEIVSVNYSREGGIASVTGNGFYAISKLMAESKGVDCVEYDEDEGSMSICFNKSYFDVNGLKDLYKEAKHAIR
jgi:hypothetical protein